MQQWLQDASTHPATRDVGGLQQRQWKGRGDEGAGEAIQPCQADYAAFRLALDGAVGPAVITAKEVAETGPVPVIDQRARFESQFEAQARGHDEAHAMDDVPDQRNPRPSTALSHHGCLCEW